MEYPLRKFSLRVSVHSEEFGLHIKQYLTPVSILTSIDKRSWRKLEYPLRKFSLRVSVHSEEFGLHIKQYLTPVSILTSIDKRSWRKLEYLLRKFSLRVSVHLEEELGLHIKHYLTLSLYTYINSQEKLEEIGRSSPEVISEGITPRRNLACILSNI